MRRSASADAKTKGTALLVPLICTVRFGQPITLAAAETKTAFLQRARAAVVALSTARPAGAASP